MNNVTPFLFWYLAGLVLATIAAYSSRYLYALNIGSGPLRDHFNWYRLKNFNVVLIFMASLMGPPLIFIDIALGCSILLFLILKLSLSDWAKKPFKLRFWENKE